VSKLAPFCCARCGITLMVANPGGVVIRATRKNGKAYCYPCGFLLFPPGGEIEIPDDFRPEWNRK
jgi:hypothetical protein